MSFNPWRWYGVASGLKLVTSSTLPPATGSHVSTGIQSFTGAGAMRHAATANHRGSGGRGGIYQGSGPVGRWGGGGGYDQQGTVGSYQQDGGGYQESLTRFTYLRACN